MSHRKQIRFTLQPHARAVGATLALALAASLLAALALAPSAGAQARAFYGVGPQGPLVANDYDRMRDGGVGTLRFVLQWQNVQPSPGTFRWGTPDSIIGNAAARGIRAMPFVFNPPDHVRNPPTRPRDRRAFREFMATLANRYGRGGTYWKGPFRQQNPGGGRPMPVTTWQLFNEQNSRHFWGARAQPRAYGRLIKAGARGIRSQNKGAEIVIGGMFQDPRGRGSMKSFRYLNRLYKVKQIRRFFDTVAVHPYAGNLRGIRRQMRRIRGVMRRNNDRSARIRVTELGWGAARGKHRLLKGPKGQARMLRRSFRLLTRHRNRRGGWNVGGISWHSWQDLPAGRPGCPFCHSSGLFRGGPNDRTPRPSWRAFRQVTP